MKTIQINLPDDLQREIQALTVNEEVFIFEAVAEKLKREKQHQFKKELIEGYQNTFEEDLYLTKDFEASDIEHWL
jgi:hypothetical protein